MSATPSAGFMIATPVDWPAERRAALQASPFGPFELQTCAQPEALLALLAQADCDALLLDGAASVDEQRRFFEAAGVAAVLIVAKAPNVEEVSAWLLQGAQDVLAPDDLAAPGMALRLRAAIERQRRELAARSAYSTDIDTGLPHQQQLIEHMSQLIALREREPAPMALLVLRIEGLAATQARFGRDIANVLRRRIGVRLRAGVRASDVVAALPQDNFAVLLGSILSPDDAARVGTKLLKSLLDPFKVAGHDLAVATAIGIAQHPMDGAQPDTLLRRAAGLAAAAHAQGRAGYANFGEAGAAAAGAANDD